MKTNELKESEQIAQQLKVVNKEIDEAIKKYPLLIELAEKLK